MTTFRLATPDDDGVIRAMLRDNAMPTWVEMAVEREPSFFAGVNHFGCDWAVIAEDRGDAIGMYTASVLPVHLNGRPERIGYLGGLRVNAAHRRRIRHLREGFATVRRLAQVSLTRPFWFTVIADDNRTARRFLESGIAGLPEYRPIGRVVGHALASSRGRRRGLWRRADEGDLEELISFHNGHASAAHCSPVLDAERVRRIGLDAFVVHEHAGETRGIAALWDQRAYKQLVARRYRRPIGALVPIWNVAARLLRLVPLPRTGGELHQTFIAFLALSDLASSDSAELLRDLLTYCRTPVASLTLHASHPWLPALKALKPIRYPMTIYQVAFDGDDARPLAGRAVQPEGALL